MELKKNGIKMEIKEENGIISMIFNMEFQSTIKLNNGFLRFADFNMVNQTPPNRTNLNPKGCNATSPVGY